MIEIDRRGQLGATHFGLVLLVLRQHAFEHVHTADEVGDEARIGKLVEIGRRRHLRQHATVHHSAARGDGQSLVLIMRHHDEGDADLFLQARQFRTHLIAELGIERRKRLVQQKHARALHQRARQRNALTLAAGKLVRHALAQAIELD